MGVWCVQNIRIFIRVQTVYFSWKRQHITLHLLLTSNVLITLQISLWFIFLKLRKIFWCRSSIYEEIIQMGSCEKFRSSKIRRNKITSHNTVGTNCTHVGVIGTVKPSNFREGPRDDFATECPQIPNLLDCYKKERRPPQERAAILLRLHEVMPPSPLHSHLHHLSHHP